MFGVGLGDVQDVAVGQIKGYIQPTAVERAAAFELFVELSSRTATVTLADEHRLVRDVLDNLALMPDITRSVLRQHGSESAKQRKDGNLALAAVALRVVNEIILPRLNRWDPLLRHWEALRPPDEIAPVWEAQWPDFDNCEADLESMRVEIRAYLDTLAKIAGAPLLGDLVVPNPPGLPIPPITLDSPVVERDTDDPRDKMVGWLDPIEGFAIARAHHRHDAGKPEGRRPATSAPPAVAADLEAEMPFDGEPFWFDYVADMGDAFDPTAAVAWQLTRPGITLPIDRTGELPQPPPALPRGRLLVMGGDQVYPFASAEAYAQQLVLPYRMVAEAQVDADPPDVSRNTVVAIPGNHDWIGGPQFFEDVFVHAETFAEHWASPQQQRWWAVRLPGRWWLWGVDTALDNQISDAAQIEYFDEMSMLLEDGDQVIVCTPVPLWQLRQKREEEYFEIRKLLSNWILARGARSPLFISGDTHMFAYYRRVDGAADEHHICAGGGGAFLQPTHNLPEQVPYERGATDFKLGQRWPRPVDSRSLGANVGAISQAQFRWLFVVIGLLHAAVAALIYFRFGQTPISESSDTEATIAAVARSWAIWPLLLLILAITIVGTVPNSRESSLSTGAKRYGALHGFAQIALFVVVASAGVLAWPDVWWWRYLIAPAIGGVLSVAMFVWFVRWINRSIRAFDTLAFSPAHLTRYKNFLRFSIDLDGTLTVYAVGLDPVGTGWHHALTHEDGMIPPFDKAGVPRLHYIWGRTFATGGKHELMELERLLGADHPDTIFHRSARARLLLDDGEVNDAIELIEMNVESCHTTFGASHRVTTSNEILLAEALLEAGDHVTTIDILHAILGDEPIDDDPPFGPRPPYLLSQAYQAVDDVAAGMRWLRHALTPFDRDDDWSIDPTEWRFSLVEMYEDLGRYEDAVELAAAVKHHTLEQEWTGMHLLARLALGRVLLRVDVERGIEEMEGALELCDQERPDLAPHHRQQLAAAYEQVGRTDRAIEVRRDILARSDRFGRRTGTDEPRHATLADMASSKAHEGEHHSAAALYEQAVADARRELGDDDPATMQLRLHLASEILQAGDPDRALSHLTSLRDHVVAVGPGSGALIASVDLAIGRAHLYRGDVAAALAVFERLDDELAGSDPTSWLSYGVWTNITEALVGLGLHERAVARMRAAYTLLADMPLDDRSDEFDALRSLAELLVSAHRAEEAVALVSAHVDDLRTHAPDSFGFWANEFLVAQHAALGRHDVALAIIDEWRHSNQGPAADPDRYSDLIGSFLRAGREAVDREVALALVDEMLTIATDHHGTDSDEARDVRRARANFELAHGSPADAAVLWSALIDEPGRLPFDSEAAYDLLRLSTALRGCGRVAEALGAAEEGLAAVERSPYLDASTRTALWIAVARGSLDGGDPDRAVAMLELALDAGVSPDDADDHTSSEELQAMLATALRRSGRRDDAVDVARSARVSAAASYPRDHPIRLAVESTVAPILDVEHAD